jgi:hypothetical protein
MTHCTVRTTVKKIRERESQRERDVMKARERYVFFPPLPLLCFLNWCALSTHQLPWAPSRSPSPGNYCLGFYCVKTIQTDIQSPPGLSLGLPNDGGANPVKRRPATPSFWSLPELTNVNRYELRTN